jgi:hypothetical protein
MPDTLSDEARELLLHFQTLKDDERARIVRLVRGLSQVAELLQYKLQRPVTSPLLA